MSGAVRDPWGEDPTHPRGDWKSEVEDGNTNLGYWDWVDHQKEMNQILDDTELGEVLGDGPEGV